MLSRQSAHLWSLALAELGVTGQQENVSQHTHAHTHAHTRTHTHTCSRAYTHTHARARTRAYAHTHARTRARTHTPTHSPTTTTTHRNLHHLHRHSPPQQGTVRKGSEATIYVTLRNSTTESALSDADDATEAPTTASASATGAAAAAAGAAASSSSSSGAAAAAAITYSPSLSTSGRAQQRRRARQTRAKAAAAAVAAAAVPTTGKAEAGRRVVLNFDPEENSSSNSDLEDSEGSHDDDRDDRNGSTIASSASTGDIESSIAAQLSWMRQEMETRTVAAAGAADASSSDDLTPADEDERNASLDRTLNMITNCDLPQERKEKELSRALDLCVALHPHPTPPLTHTPPARLPFPHLLMYPSTSSQHARTHHACHHSRLHNKHSCH
jgi:hypothetical protein